MRTLLINPPVWDTRAPPLNLAYLASYAKNSGFDVNCFDMNIELFNLIPKEKRKYWLREYNAWWHNSFLYHYKLMDELGKGNFQLMKSKILKYKPDVVGFTLNISPPLVIDLSKDIKKTFKDVIIMVGGNGAERYFYGNSLLNSGFIDLLVLGEGEETFLEILKRIKSHQSLKGIKGTVIKEHEKIIQNHRRERILNIDKIQFPDFSDFNLSLYKERDLVTPAKYLTTLFSRGCINNCDYCAQNQIWGKPFLMRSPENMFSEIQYMIKNYNVRKFIFSDLEVNGDLNKLEKFCDLVIKSQEEITWEGSAIIRNDMSAELIKKMKESGCSLLDLGLESGSETVLREMGKYYTKTEAQEFFHKLKKADIPFGVSIIVGHPKEGKKEFQETLNLLKESKQDLNKITPGVSSCAIFPHTPLYEKFPKFGKTSEREKALQWKIEGNDFRERKRRIKEFNEVSQKELNGRGMMIPDGKVYDYTEKESSVNPVLDIVLKQWKNKINFFGSDVNYVTGYLNTIHREDLIDFYLNRIRKDYGIDFQYKEEGNSHIYPIYPNLIKTKHFRIKGEYVGSDEKLTFYLKIPKNISLLQIRLPLTGIKGKSTFTAILNNKPLGTFTVNQMSKGDAEIIEFVIDDVKELIKKEIVKFELKVLKGNLAIYEQAKNTNLKGITLSYGTDNLLIHGKRFENKDFKLLGTDGILFIKNNKKVPFVQIKLHVTAIEQDAKINNIFIHKMATGEYETVTMIIENPPNIIPLKVDGTVAIYNNQFQLIYPEPFKPSNQYSIYTPYRNGIVMEYNNQDNFNKGYKFLILEENSELFYPLKEEISELQIQLASIDKNTIAQINSTEIQPIPLAGGKGKIYSIKTKGNLIKIKCKQGKLAILQEPLEKHLPRTPIITKT